MKAANSTSLPTPTVELILDAEKLFDQEKKTTEEALTGLFQQFPQNAERFQVLLKVAAINQLYPTNIYDVRSVAKHIADLTIDSELAAARECLWAYKRQFNLGFPSNDLWKYSSFFKAVKEFQDRFDVHPLSFNAEETKASQNPTASGSS